MWGRGLARAGSCVSGLLLCLRLSLRHDSSLPPSLPSFLPFFWAAPAARGRSQARGQMGAAPAATATLDQSCTCGLRHSSQPCQILNPGIERVSSWTLIGFVSAEPHGDSLGGVLSLGGRALPGLFATRPPPSPPEEGKARPRIPSWGWAVGRFSCVCVCVCVHTCGVLATGLRLVLPQQVARELACRAAGWECQERRGQTGCFAFQTVLKHLRIFAVLKTFNKFPELICTYPMTTVAHVWQK